MKQVNSVESSFMFDIMTLMMESRTKEWMKLSEASIPTRYPENLEKLQQIYDEIAVKDILAGGQEVIRWIKGLL